MKFGKLMQNSIPMASETFVTGSRIPIWRSFVFRNRKQ